MAENVRITRTRFAPSPTGALHIGGLRTALINYLFAKKHNGEFILRIEDTDKERNQKGLERKILDDLERLSLIPDESFEVPGRFGPYLQSKRGPIYKERIETLLSKKKAYRCFCDNVNCDLNIEQETKGNFYSGECRKLSDKEVKERLERGESYSIRLKIEPTKVYSWRDYVRGDMKIPASSMGDIILVRSSGSPTYNFAVTVDDYEMKISDVFRGEEHLSNTPYQLALYEAFGWEDAIPNFGHFSLILSEEGKKISKRDKDSNRYFVSYFIERGYYPEALLNYLLILGWTSGEKELFNLRESIELFTPEGLSGSPSTFDQQKLDWVNQSYLNQLDALQYLNFVLPFFKGEKTGEFSLSIEQKKEFAIRFRSRVKYGAFLEELAANFYSESYLTERLVRELRGEKGIISFLKHCLESLKDFRTETESSNKESSEEELKLFLKKTLSKSLRDRHFFYSNLRLALIGEREGLPLHSIIYLLGNTKTLLRLERVLNVLEHTT